MQETYRIGNAQTIGTCQVQSNYFSTRNGGCVLAVLADGTIDHMNGRRCAVLAVEVCMREFSCMPADGELLPFFDLTAEKILQEMRSLIYLGKMPRLSLSVLFIRDRKLFYYTIGETDVFLYDGRDYRILEERKGSAVFEKGMTAGLISRGMRESLYAKEMVSYLKRREHPYDKAQHMIMGVKDKNRKKAGNATVVLVERRL